MKKSFKSVWIYVSILFSLTWHPYKAMQTVMGPKGGDRTRELLAAVQQSAAKEASNAELVQQLQTRIVNAGRRGIPSLLRSSSVVSKTKKTQEDEGTKVMQAQTLQKQQLKNQKIAVGGISGASIGGFLGLLFGGLLGVITGFVFGGILGSVLGSVK